MFYSFLWNNKPDKIKRNTANQKLTNGGLDMLDVDKFDKSLKLTWIRRFFNSKAKWKLITENQYRKLLKCINLGEQFHNLILKDMKNEFWRDVIKALHLFSNNYNLESKKEIEASSFLFNNKIKIGNSHIKSNISIENYIFRPSINK